MIHINKVQIEILKKKGKKDKEESRKVNKKRSLFGIGHIRRRT